MREELVLTIVPKKDSSYLERFMHDTSITGLILKLPDDFNINFDFIPYARLGNTLKFDIGLCYELVSYKNIRSFIKDILKNIKLVNNTLNIPLNLNVWLKLGDELVNDLYAYRILLLIAKSLRKHNINVGIYLNYSYISYFNIYFKPANYPIWITNFSRLFDKNYFKNYNVKLYEFNSSFYGDNLCASIKIVDN